jgi:DNA modification methylase
VLLKGDCRHQLATLPDNSVHAIITDPPYELGFMGKTWDSTGIAYNLEVWTQCLRVLKPGGHLLAFGGSRTYHRLACAIEDAGFEIRDQIMWVYGSGFPKSLNVSKSIEGLITTGSANKTAFKHLAGEQVERGDWGIAKQQFVHGQRDTNYDETASPTRLGKLEPTTDEAKQWDGWGTALKPAHEPIVLARKPLNGTVANNVLTHGVGALNINDCRVGTDGATTRSAQAPYSESGWRTGHDVVKLDAGRWPANFIHDGSDEVLELFPDSKGGDSGSAARFFYCAKASRTERNTGLEHLQPQRHFDRPSDNLPSGDNPRNRTNTPQTNFHPTVKPLALIHYLIKLVTPPGGTILDPFLGSGTTAVAATQLGHPWIGCELTPDYWPIIEARVNHAKPLT